MALKTFYLSPKGSIKGDGSLEDPVHCQTFVSGLTIPGDDTADALLVGLIGSPGAPTIYTQSAPILRDNFTNYLARSRTNPFSGTPIFIAGVDAAGAVIRPARVQAPPQDTCSQGTGKLRPEDFAVHVLLDDDVPFMELSGIASVAFIGLWIEGDAPADLFRVPRPPVRPDDRAQAIIFENCHVHNRSLHEDAGCIGMGDQSIVFNCDLLLDAPATGTCLGGEAQSLVAGTRFAHGHYGVGRGKNYWLYSCLFQNHAQSAVRYDPVQIGTIVNCTANNCGAFVTVDSGLVNPEGATAVVNCQVTGQGEDEFLRAQTPKLTTFLALSCRVAGGGELFNKVIAHNLETLILAPPPPEGDYVHVQGDVENDVFRLTGSAPGKHGALLSTWDVGAYRNETDGCNG